MVEDKKAVHDERQNFIARLSTYLWNEQRCAHMGDFGGRYRHLKSACTEVSSYTNLPKDDSPKIICIEKLQDAQKLINIRANSGTYTKDGEIENILDAVAVRCRVYMLKHGLLSSIRDEGPLD